MASAISAALLSIGIGVTGDTDAVQKVAKISRETERFQEKSARASRTIANFGRQIIEAGEAGAAALSGIVQQAADIAFAFGPAGAVVGAVATTGIAIANMFLKAQHDAAEFQLSLRKLKFDADFRGALSQLHELDFQISEARRTLQQSKADAATAGRSSGPVDAQTAAALRTIREAAQRKAQSDEDALNKLLAKRVDLVKVSQDLAVQVGEQQQIGLEIQQEMTAQAEREAKARQAAAQAERDKAQAARDRQAAQTALEKAGQGITLGGPGVDLGVTGRAPTLPATIAIAPTLVVDDAARLAMREQIKEILEADLDSKELGVNLEFANLGTTVVEQMTTAIATAAGKGFDGAGELILGALGGIFKKMGSALIAYGAAMLKLLPHLLNPFTSGPAAIAAGALLFAVGTALAGAATGSGGGGGGGGGFSSNVGEVTAAAQITNITIGASGSQQTVANLTPRTPVHFTVIGTGDPKAMRDIAELWKGAKGRGLL